MIKTPQRATVCFDCECVLFCKSLDKCSKCFFSNHSSRPVVFAAQSEMIQTFSFFQLMLIHIMVLLDGQPYVVIRLGNTTPPIIPKNFQKLLKHHWWTPVGRVVFGPDYVWHLRKQPRFCFHGVSCDRVVHANERIWHRYVTPWYSRCFSAQSPEGTHALFTPASRT